MKKTFLSVPISLLFLISACDEESCLDNDGDGYCADVDCADNNSNYHTSQNWYADCDGDGFYRPEPVSHCGKPPAYMIDCVQFSQISWSLQEPTDNPDCDDLDPDQFPGQKWYIDCDGDGFFSGQAITSCERPVADLQDCADLGEKQFSNKPPWKDYVDCNDRDAEENPKQKYWYPDCDGDGFFSKDAVKSLCVRPTNSDVCPSGDPVSWSPRNPGYQTDCNDSSSLFSECKWQAFRDHTHVTGLHVDEKDNVWFASLEGGVTYIDTNGTPADYSDDRIASISWPTSWQFRNYITEIVADKKGGLWILADEIVYYHHNDTPFDTDDDHWIKYPEISLTGYSVITLKIDHQGGKWFGTARDGLVHLDDNNTPLDKNDDILTRFRKYDGLPGEGVGAIAFDAKGGKWLGTNEGLAYLDDANTPSDKSDDRWATFENSIYSFLMTDIKLDSKQNLWIVVRIGSTYEFLWFDDNGTPFEQLDDSVEWFYEDDGLPTRYIEFLFVDKNDGKWIGTLVDGLFYFDDNNTPALTADDALTVINHGVFPDEISFLELAVDSTGGKWVGTLHEGPLYFDDNGTAADKNDDAWSEPRLTGNLETLRYEMLQDFAIASDGSKWVLSGVGNLDYLDDNQTPLDKSDDLWVGFDAFAYSVVTDNNNNPWFVDHYGIFYLDYGETPEERSDDAWIYFRVEDGLPGDGELQGQALYNLAFDKQGGKWIASLGFGLAHLDDNQTPDKEDDIWTYFTIEDGLPGNWLENIIIDDKGYIWTIASGKLTCFDYGNTPSNKSDDRWIYFDNEDGLPTEVITDMAFDQGGALWMTTRSGLGYFSNSGTPFEKSDDTWMVFGDESFDFLGIDQQGGKWLASDSRIVFFDEQDTILDTDDDLWLPITCGGSEHYSNIISLEVDSMGNKWIGNPPGLQILRVDPYDNQ